MTTSSGKFVGIDVAKDKLDIAVLGEKKASQVGNDEVGIASLIKKMQKLVPHLIVVEATGGYQRAVVLGLYEAGLPVAVVNPTRVRVRSHQRTARQDGQVGCLQPGRVREADETEPRQKVRRAGTYPRF